MLIETNIAEKEKNLTELLDSSYLTPKLPFDVNQDGSITIKG